MFGVLRQLSIPKLSADILRWTFYTSRFMGSVGFRLKNTSNDRVMMEDSPLMWKWFFAIIRIGCISVFIYMYTQWKMPSSDLTEKVLQFNRVLLQFACCMSIVRLHLYQGPEVTQLVNSFLQLYRRVQGICNRNQNGFGGRDELIFLVFMLICLIHEEVFLLRLIKPYWTALQLLGWLADTYISFGIKMMTYIACLWYLSLGLLYSDLNECLRSELETLDLQPSDEKLKNIQKRLKKCLKLYRDLNFLTSKFQQVYEIPLFFAMAQNIVCILLFAYLVITRIRFHFFLLYSNTVVQVLNMFLLTSSIRRAVIKFRESRLLILSNSNLSKIRNWHKTSEFFYMQLSVDEFRVRPLGLFDVSNKLFLAFFSAIVSYLTFFIQYRMQMK